MVGTPIRANEPLLIKHCHTGQWLASDLVTYQNDFGSEYEVSAHSFINLKKT